MNVAVARPYEPEPTYPPARGAIHTGWDLACADLGPGTLLAVDGPNVLDWTVVVACITEALRAREVRVVAVDVREQMVSWAQVVKRTASVDALAGDPDFATLAGGTIADLYDKPPTSPGRPDAVVVAFGPGAALVGADQLWYADLPKRYAEAAVGSRLGHNLGQRPGDGAPTTRRLFYIDWPLLDRHRDAMAARLDRWVDVRDPRQPTWLDGADLRAALTDLAGRPFRTRPTFNTTSWGGHWGQERLGLGHGAPNTALGYELIAPESGVLIGEPGRAVEVPFQLVVALHPDQMLGPDVRAQFHTSFPIRFDYLDTVGGGSLSVHCHPREEYMRDIFGWPYTQHETYYIMVGGADNAVFLGLREGVDIDEFHQYAHAADAHQQEFDIKRFVQTHPATPHQLFLIPAGTPHGSGKGNVVLEVSATPYLYSLRFYDWLRVDSAGNQRPVHVGHAFRNLDPRRSGASVRRDLVQQPRVLVQDEDWREESLGVLPQLFFEVRRVVIEPSGNARADTAGRFHVLNVVSGAGVVIETDTGTYSLVYAETLVVPASVGAYQITALGTTPVMVVKALVR
jgi:mannose-6-phosphate isomerase class I